MADIIKFDMNVLDLIEQHGDKFLVDPRAEDTLIKWKEFKEAVEATDKIVKEKLIERMKQLNTVRIEGQSIRVSRRYFGDRYDLSDKETAKKLGLAKEIVWVKPDAPKIDEYVENIGELPDGVVLKERTESIVITEAKEK